MDHVSIILKILTVTPLVRRLAGLSDEGVYDHMVAGEDSKISVMQWDMN